MINLDESNFALSVANGITLVDFWAPWCGPCQSQMPILEDIAQTFRDEVTIAKVNVDDYPALADRFSVQGIPTLIIFEKGKVAKRFVGVQLREVLVSGIKEVL